MYNQNDHTAHSLSFYFHGFLNSHVAWVEGLESGGIRAIKDWTRLCQVLVRDTWPDAGRANGVSCTARWPPTLVFPVSDSLLQVDNRGRGKRAGEEKGEGSGACKL
jgi:hypothetical protein